MAVEKIITESIQEGVKELTTGMISRLLMVNCSTEKNQNVKMMRLLSLGKAKKEPLRQVSGAAMRPAVHLLL
ncbi:hypothetical protein ACFL1G_02465 [Planctomycetota bacterium]